MTKQLALIIINLALVSGLFSCRSRNASSIHAGESAEVIEAIPFDETLVELPAHHTADDEKLLSYCGFNVSYNTKRKVPNWVAYELTAEETRGKLARKGYFFQPDPTLSDDEVAITRDYSKSGYSRGHLAPAGDMKWDDCALRSCFYLTNICPQNREMNAGCWEKLESKCRHWARQKERGLYIICGPIFKPTEEKTIGTNKVSVPFAFFKAVVQKRGDTYKGIAFIMPNKEIKLPLSYFALSIDALEEITGFDFFHNLPDDLEDAIESELNISDWDLYEYEGNIINDIEFK